MTLELRYATHSETGLVRKNNQDSGYASPRLLAVADGMGGAAAGDLASAVAIDALRVADRPVEGEDILRLLTGAFREANDRISDLVDEDYSLDGMGTTVTAMMFDGASVGLAHIGDSRAYLFRDGRLERLTHDHSWVQSLVDDGKISDAEATVHPHRSLLLRVLNGQPANDPDLTRVPLRDGDRLLICSDGLCGLVDDPEIGEALAEPDRATALDRLTAAALAAGGADNITIIVADAVPPGEPRTGSAAAAAEDATSGAAVDGPPQVLGAAAIRDIPAVASAQRTVRVRRSSAASAPKRRDSDGPVRDPDDDGGADPDGDAADPRAEHPSAGEFDADTAAHAVVVPDSDGDGGVDDGEDEDRYVPRAPAHPHRGRRLALALTLTVVLIGLITGGYAWTRTQYYVGAAGPQVAIFQGLSDAVPGLGLARVYEVQPVLVADLPPFFQQQVQATISVSDLSAARKTVATLHDEAQRCRAQRGTATGPPTASPSATPSRSASAPASTRPTTSPSTRPTTRSTTRPTTRPPTRPAPRPSLHPSPQPAPRPSPRPSVPTASTTPTAGATPAAGEGC